MRLRNDRIGVSHDHHHYTWWVLSCTSLGMLLAEPKHTLHAVEELREAA